jgi:hypothetical protein
MPLPMPMPADQGSTDFLSQLKEFAKGFISWIQEEGQEQEHPQQPGGTVIDQHPADLPGGQSTPGGGAVPMPNEQPTLLRTRTTTVHDFTPPGQTDVAQPGQTPVGQPGMATDPPVSEAQRGAMHAAAQGQGNLGIPASVGKEFANADPGGKLPEKKGQDDLGAEERFSLSPDGQTIIDNQGGKSYSIEEAMQILFSGGQMDASPAAVPPAGKVDISQPNTEVNTANWSSPKISPVGGNDKPLGDGEGGTALGRLLNYVAGSKENGMQQGNGWDSPPFLPTKQSASDFGRRVQPDAGTAEGAKKGWASRGHGGAAQPGAPRQVGAQPPSPGAARGAAPAEHVSHGGIKVPAQFGKPSYTQPNGTQEFTDKGKNELNIMPDGSWKMWSHQGETIGEGKGMAGLHEAMQGLPTQGRQPVKPGQSAMAQSWGHPSNTVAKSWGVR